ncbi:MAG TPA: hypothetical protein VFW05_10250 [Verrucomicrobiae bacterium]|nr:hypothetical protein [Verrucomicrobiae bacterium]
MITKPSGAIACAKFTSKNLLLPYSFGNEGKLSGHYYDLRIDGKKLIGRFEQFDSAGSGVFFLEVGPNQTLVGGRWIKDRVPENVECDLSKLTDSLPGMESVVWLRMPRAETPDWAQKYFDEEWPNKPL